MVKYDEYDSEVFRYKVYYKGKYSGISVDCGEVMDDLSSVHIYVMDIKRGDNKKEIIFSTDSGQDYRSNFFMQVSPSSIKKLKSTPDAGTPSLMSNVVTNGEGKVKWDDAGKFTQVLGCYTSNDEYKLTNGKLKYIRNRKVIKASKIWSSKARYILKKGLDVYDKVNGKKKFKIKEKDEFRLIEVRTNGTNIYSVDGGWAKIKTTKGKTGWIKTAKISYDGITPDGYYCEMGFFWG